MENAEINNIIKIVGLQYKKNYEDEDSLKTLRYGKIMIMTDQVRFLNWCQMYRLSCPLPTAHRMAGTTSLLHYFPALESYY